MQCDRERFIKKMYFIFKKFMLKKLLLRQVKREKQTEGWKSLVDDFERKKKKESCVTLASRAIDIV